MALIARIRNPRDFWAGLIYIAIGVGAVVLAQDYKMGTAIRMGPGYFPVVLGGLLMAIGIISVGRSLVREGEPIGSFALKGLLLVVGGMLLTGFLFRKAGLVVALPLLIMITSYASIKFRWGASLALAAGLTAFCMLIFAYGLGLPLPVLGKWFGA
ncbi:tripartite tricarboxylate transporter TctB family protein [Noviherbaspirillum sedimenti]|uniref:tripartite tricarboxylate transporter TctB family protein n=1 Tax=Noviherbaspirillum sedimenti TaxID=2320865 RepID=UPI001F170935|nr:tripartite tricarboxylate transporter TctB family protein [Noviherbaspirillum sedimenti]